MELLFEHISNLGAGVNPSAVHLPDNNVILFSVLDGVLNIRNWVTVAGDVPWGTPAFSAPTVATHDTNMSSVRLKNVPRVGVFGTWHQDTVLDRFDNVVTPERHRFAIWGTLSDITNYLTDGGVQLNYNNNVSTSQMTFKNPLNKLMGEDNSLINPGMKIELFFSAGDSDDYPMGVFYIDRIDFKTGGGDLSIDCRNISGKLLKDQQFNETTDFGPQLYHTNVTDILDYAGVENYDVQSTSVWEMGMRFPSDMDLLSGLKELIRTAKNWRLLETLDGDIIAGSSVTYDPIKNYNSNYVFYRGYEVFSRGIVRDDQDVYSRVCCQCKYKVGEVDYTRRVYKGIYNDYDWVYQAQKTFIYTAPDETSEVELGIIGDGLVESLSKSGIVETFEGPFRPHLVTGDIAEIISNDGARLIGVITNVTHKFGDSGFGTSFTVDSAGIAGKGLLTDYIEKINKKQSVAKATRIY